MIYPETNKPVRWFFSKYIPWIIRRNFHAVNFDTISIDPGQSVLLLANHFSWWDAFLMYYVFNKLTPKKLYVMVLADNMKAHPFLKYIGAFSVGKLPGEIIQSLDYAAELLANPNNLVLLFPQGKLYSNFVNDVHFEKGAIKIIDKAAGKFQLVYAAAFIENFQHKKPDVNVYLSKVTNSTFENIEKLTAAYQQHYNAARQRQTKIVI